MTLHRPATAWSRVLRGAAAVLVVSVLAGPPGAAVMASSGHDDCHDGDPIETVECTVRDVEAAAEKWRDALWDEVPWDLIPSVPPCQPWYTTQTDLWTVTSGVDHVVPDAREQPVFIDVLLCTYGIRCDVFGWGMHVRIEPWGSVNGWYDEDFVSGVGACVPTLAGAEVAFEAVLGLGNHIHGDTSGVAARLDAVVEGPGVP